MLQCFSSEIFLRLTCLNMRGQSHHVTSNSLVFVFTKYGKNVRNISKYIFIPFFKYIPKMNPFKQKSVLQWQLKCWTSITYRLIKTSTVCTIFFSVKACLMDILFRGEPLDWVIDTTLSRLPNHKIKEKILNICKIVKFCKYPKTLSKPIYKQKQK